MSAELLIAAFNLPPRHQNPSSPPAPDWSLSPFGLLILYELGYAPFSKEGSQLLFQVPADRYERASVIITRKISAKG